MRGSTVVKHCLVADGSAAVRKVARRILESLSYRVSEAETAEQALDLCRVEMPDAILLDGNMPPADGFAVLGRLREMPGGAAPKVIFCLVEHDRARIARALHAGADACIAKPFDRDSLSAEFGSGPA